MSIATISNAIRARFNTQVVTNYAGMAPQLLSKTTVAVDGTANSFTDATEDLSIFENSNQILVTGFTDSNNNGLFRVKLGSVTEDAIPVAETAPVTEAAGDTVSIKTALPVQYDNDGTFRQPADSLWVRLNILFGQTQLTTFGATHTKKYIGEMIAGIFYPVGYGTSTVESLANTIETAFQCVRDTGVLFNTPYPSVAIRDESWWFINIHCPFEYDANYTI